MRIRLYKAEKDLADLEAWWAKFNQPPPIPEMLPTTGLVVESDDGVKLAAGWIIETSMQTALFEWITRNPEISKEQAGEALDFLVTNMKTIAKNLGYKLYMTFLINKSLKQRFKNHGALAGDANLQSFIGGL